MFTHRPAAIYLGNEPKKKKKRKTTDFTQQADVTNTSIPYKIFSQSFILINLGEHKMIIQREVYQKEETICLITDGPSK